MAGKKPAKPMAGQAKAETKDPAIYGSMTKFMGMKNCPCVCASCGREVIRGMVRVKSETFFCSAACAKVDWLKSQIPAAQ